MLLSEKEIKMEPPNWWVGMKDTRFQLMVHGQNIANYNFENNVAGLNLINTERTHNPNYLFLYFEINNTLAPGTYQFTFSDNKACFCVTYQFKSRYQNAANRKGFDQSDAIYLINIDRFCNGNQAIDNSIDTQEKSNRDHKYGRHGGDIQGIINQLDYIKSMGFTCVWPTPIEINNMPEQSYHGYAITDFYQVDPRFGSLHDYVTLCHLAGEKNIKIIKDVVLNHCGINHQWLVDLPDKDWINFNNEYVPTNHRHETIVDIYASEYDKKQFSDGWFVPTMPDLNQRNRHLATYLIQNTLWWCESAWISGLRIDTFPYVDPNFSAQFCKAVLNEYPNLNIVGEEWNYNTAITAYWQKGKVNHDAYLPQLTTVMDFPLKESITLALNSNWQDSHQGLTKVYQVLANDFLYAYPENVMTFVDNHDMNRFYTSINQNLEHYKIGLLLLATLRGLPQFYYGTEVLLTNPHSDSHGDVRKDMPGGWPGDTKNAFTGQGLNKYQKEAQAFCKWLFNFRKETPVLHFGKLKHFAPENGIYTYFRYDNEQILMIIINQSDKKAHQQVNKYQEILNNKTIGIDLYSRQTIYFEKGIQLAPKSFAILKIEN